MITGAQIQEVKEKIVREFDPDKIVLFGSYAKGEPNENSDLDLLIIKNSKETTQKLSRELRQLFWKRDFPMDLIVYKPEQIEEWKEEKLSFIMQVLTSGKVLYEK